VGSVFCRRCTFWHFDFSIPVFVMLVPFCENNNEGGTSACQIDMGTAIVAYNTETTSNDVNPVKDDDARFMTLHRRYCGDLWGFSESQASFSLDLASNTIVPIILFFVWCNYSNFLLGIRRFAVEELQQISHNLHIIRVET
jgi:hypothetical protein